MFNTTRIKTEIEDDGLNYDDIPLEIQVNADIKLEKNDYKLEENISSKLDHNEDRFEVKRDKTNVKNNDMVKQPIGNDNVQYPGLSDLTVFCASSFSNLNEKNENLQRAKEKEKVLNEEIVAKHISNARATINYIKAKEKTLYKCSNCDFTADTKITVDIHEYRHILYCSVCKHPCKSQNLLTEHLKLHPSCDECSFIAISEAYLRGHKELEHPASSKLSPNNKTVTVQRNFDATASKTNVTKRKVEPKITLNANIKQSRLNLKGNEIVASKAGSVRNSVPTANVSVTGNSLMISSSGLVGSSVLATNAGLATNSGLAASTGLVGNKGVGGNSDQAANIGLAGNSGFIGNAGLLANSGLPSGKTLVVYYLPPVSVSAAEKAILSRYRRIAVNPKQTLYPSQSSNTGQSINLSQPTNTGQSINLSQPTNTGQSINLSQPTNTGQSINLSQPTNTGQSINLSQPTNTGKSINLTQPTNAKLAYNTGLSAIHNPGENSNLIAIPNLSPMPKSAAILNLGVNSSLPAKPDLAEIPNIGTNLGMSTSLRISALNKATKPKLKENSNVPTNVSVSSKSNVPASVGVSSKSNVPTSVSVSSKSNVPASVSVSSNSSPVPNPSLPTNAIQSRNRNQAIYFDSEYEEITKRWKYCCKPCQYLTNSKTEFKKHMSFENVRCKNCSTFFHSKDHLSNHKCPKKLTFSKFLNTFGYNPLSLTLNQSQNSNELISFNATKVSTPSAIEPALEVAPNAFIKTEKESYNHGDENPYAGNNGVSIIPDITEEENTAAKNNGTYSKISKTKKLDTIKTELDIGYKIKIEHSSPVSSCVESIEYNNEELINNESRYSTAGLIFKCMMCEQDFQTENDLNSHNCCQSSSLNAPSISVKPNEGKPTKRKNRKTAYEQKSCYEIDYDDDGLYDTEPAAEKDFPNESSQRYPFEEMPEKLKMQLDWEFDDEDEGDDEIESCDSTETLDSDDSDNPANIITFDDSDEDAEPFDCEVTTEPALIESDSC